MRINGLITSARRKSIKRRARCTAQHLRCKGNSLTIYQANSNDPGTERLYKNRKARSPFGISFITKKSCSITPPKILMLLIMYLIINHILKTFISPFCRRTFHVKICDYCILYLNALIYKKATPGEFIEQSNTPHNHC